MNIKLNEITKKVFDEELALAVLIDCGFVNTDEILNMRVFDLLNIYRIDQPRAASILYCLYKYLNDNELADKELSYGYMTQNFDYKIWHKKHRHYNEVTVKDIVLADGINAKAIDHILNLICRAFYRSEEYNWKEYRFSTRTDYLDILSLRGITNE